MKSSRLTINGQITIPKKLREAFGWAPHTELRLQRLADGVKVTRPDRGKGRGGRIVERLRGRGNRKWRTGEIMAWTRGEKS